MSCGIAGSPSALLSCVVMRANPVVHCTQWIVTAIFRHIALTSTVCADFSFLDCCWPRQCNACACMFSTSYRACQQQMHVSLIHYSSCLVQMAWVIGHHGCTPMCNWQRLNLHRVWATVTVTVCCAEHYILFCCIQKYTPRVRVHCFREPDEMPDS